MIDVYMCMSCNRDRNECTCATWLSIAQLGAYNTQFLKQMFEEMTDPGNRWPDGREDNAAAWIKKELELRGVQVEYPLALTLKLYNHGVAVE